MAKESKGLGRGSWAIGGTTMIGLGIGFVFLTTNIFVFIACLLSGIGLGLVIAAILPDRKT